MKLVDRLAVCSWSLQPKTPEQLLGYVKTIGIPRVQLALEPVLQRSENVGQGG